MLFQRKTIQKSLKSMPLTYRADIDGLRAIAVLVVIFYHAGLSGFSGGFVGVDVFFVISGFLITSIISKEIYSGEFSIARFYERRIRRIFPALFPVLAFTVIVSAILFNHLEFKAFGQSIVATTLFASNILFWRESGYFDAASVTKPLLHTWSLAVEEQFYIFFPLLLSTINRFSKNNYLPWLLGICLVSLIASIYGAYTHQMATFYLVPTRAWELLFGSILALGVIPKIKSNIILNLFSIIGLCLILYSVLAFSDTTIFPGASALLPVGGATLIIYTGEGERGKSAISKLLGLKPLVYIGLISYSLYLWHWPLFVFVKYLFFRDLKPLEIFLIILATCIISAFSLTFIEKPFRGKKSVISDRKKLFGLAAIVMLISSMVGIVIDVRDGMNGRIERFNPGITAPFTKVQNDKIWDKYEEWGKITEKLKAGVNPPTVGTMNIKPTFAIYGDSHAVALIPAIEYEANQYMVSGFVLTMGGVPPLSGIDISDDSVDEVRINNGVLNFIKVHPEIKTVILAGRWAANIKGHYGHESSFNYKLHDSFGEYNENQANAILLKAVLKELFSHYLLWDEK